MSREELKERIRYLKHYVSGYGGLMATTKLPEEQVTALLELFEEFAKEAIDDYIKPHLTYCQEQNGMPYCKNCGLSEQEEERE